MYIVPQEILEKYPELVTLNEANKPVNLAGKRIEKQMPGDANNAPKVRIVEAANQKDLEFLFKKGHPFIVEVADTNTTSVSTKEVK